MFNSFRSVANFVIPRRGTLNDTEQDSAYASADNQKPESDIESKHEDDEAVVGFDGTNEDEEEESGSDSRQSAYYSAESGSAYSQDEPKDEVTDETKEETTDEVKDQVDDEAKEEIKDDPKEETKDEVNDETMDEVNDEIKDEAKDEVNEVNEVTNSPKDEEMQDIRLSTVSSDGSRDVPLILDASTEPNPIIPTINPVTPPPKPITSSQETNFGGDWLDDITEEEHARLQRIAEEGLPNQSEYSWAPDDDLAGFNAPSPTPSELARRAARAARFAIPDPPHHARSPGSVDDTSSDSIGDEFSLRPRTRKPKPPAVPFNYAFTPTPESSLARAALVQSTPSDELYYSHPNPLTLQHPDWLVFPPSSDPSNPSDDLESNIQRTIRSYECYYSLPPDQTIPQWMETLLRELVTWSSSANPSLSPKKVTTYSGAVSEPWSDSTGLFSFSELGEPSSTQPGECYWSTPSDLVPLLLRADRTIQGRPKNTLQVTNPDPEMPPEQEPTSPPPPQENKGKRPASTPKQNFPAKKSKTSPSNSPSPSRTTDGAADSGPKTSSVPNWPPQRGDSRRVVRPATINPAPAGNGGGYTFWDAVFFFLLLVSLLWAWQLNVLVTAGYGGYMNGGYGGWSTFLTFSNLVHIILVMVPCLYFGARLAYNSS